MVHVAENMEDEKRKKISDFAKVSYALIWEKYFKGCEKVLDAGCGDGPFSSLDSKRITGLDLEKGNFFKGDNFVSGSVTNIPFPDNTFDGIFCSHVLEHVLAPLDVLKEFYRVLKPGGKVIILVPSYWTLFILSSKYNFFSEPTHVRPFTPFSITNAFQWTGFDVKEVCYNKFYFPFVRFFYRAINKPNWYRNFVRHISCPIPPYELFAFAIKP